MRRLAVKGYGPVISLDATKLAYSPAYGDLPDTLRILDLAPGQCPHP